MSRIIGCVVVVALGLAGDPVFAQTTDRGTVRDLPLVEVRPSGAAGRTLALLITGDGDWAAYVKSIANALAADGVGVVGLKARTYLSAAHRTPDDAARDAARVLRHYLDAWGADSIVLVGYSRGGDMIPFVASRLPDDLRTRVRLIALLSPSTRASFEFHWTDLVKDTARPTDLPTQPEVEQLRGMAILCQYGREEVESLCESAPAGLMRVDVREGGHRTRDWESAAALILAALRAR